MARLRRAFFATIWIVSVLLLWIFTNFSHNNREEKIYKRLLFNYQNTRRTAKESNKTNETRTRHSQGDVDGGLLEDFFQSAQNSRKMDKLPNDQAETSLRKLTEQNGAKPILQKVELRHAFNNSQPNYPTSKLTEPNRIQNFQKGELDDGLKFGQNGTLYNSNTNDAFTTTLTAGSAAKPRKKTRLEHPKTAQTVDAFTNIHVAKTTTANLTQRSKSNLSKRSVRKPQRKNDHLPRKNSDRNVRTLTQEESLFETNFDVIDSKGTILDKSDAPFVLVVPKVLKRKSFHGKKVEIIDQTASMVAVSLLRNLTNFDGVACLPRSLKHKKPVSFQEGSSNEKWKGLFNSTWCNFLKRRWSVQIRNSGHIQRFLTQTNISVIFQFCNIINGPFVLRKNKFRKLRGLHVDYGRLGLLDFFLRSKGQLKISKTSECYFSDQLFEIDRGRLEGKGDFPEYSNFGIKHNVFRIITEDKIEWTKCVATDKLCKEVPYLGPPTTLPRIAQPICCSVLLGEILKDAVKVFTALRIKYRVLYSTLLGGERSGAIIPYAHDIDFLLEDKYAHDQSSYESLQKYFGKKYYISGHSFIDFPRLIPLFPAHLNITTGPFFKDEYDLRGDKFFSRAVNDSMDDWEFLFLSESDWRTRTYADFYELNDKPYWKGWSNVTINGENYTTAKNTHQLLKEWYGEDWRRPILKYFRAQSDEGQAPDPEDV